MIEICIICHKQYGVRSPFGCSDETDGMCLSCGKLNIKQLEKFQNKNASHETPCKDNSQEASK